MKEARSGDVRNRTGTDRLCDRFKDYPAFLAQVQVLIIAHTLNHSLVWNREVSLHH